MGKIMKWCILLGKCTISAEISGTSLSLDSVWISVDVSEISGMLAWRWSLNGFWANAGLLGIEVERFPSKSVVTIVGISDENTKMKKVGIEMQANVQTWFIWFWFSHGLKIKSEILNWQIRFSWAADNLS